MPVNRGFRLRTGASDRQSLIVTSTAFNARHQQRYPLQRDAVQSRLHTRHLGEQRAAAADDLWLVGRGGVHVEVGLLGAGRYGRHEMVYATARPARQLVLVRVEFLVQPDDR